MTEIAAVKSPCLQQIAKAFKVNMDRTAYFQMCPVEIAYQSRRDAIMQCNAGNLASGRPNTLISDFIEQELSPEFRAIFEIQIAEIERLPRVVRNDLRVKLGLCYIEALLKANNDGMKITVDSLFASIIMSSWTAFECLASDAWVAFVNNASARVRTAVNDSPRVRKKGVEEENEPTASRIDPAKDWAGSLREARRVSFQTLGDIKIYYGIALGKPIMKRIFNETAQGYIKALSKVRNVLTHKAGIVDHDFFESVKAFPELNFFEEGKPLLLDGWLVKKLRGAAYQVAAAILAEMDNIISPQSGDFYMLSASCNPLPFL